MPISVVEVVHARFAWKIGKLPSRTLPRSDVGVPRERISFFHVSTNTRMIVSVRGRGFPRNERTSNATREKKD